MLDSHTAAFQLMTLYFCPSVTSRVSNKQTRQMVNSPMLYLDNDLQHKLSLQPGVAPLIVEQIIKDSEFLTGLLETIHIMLSQISPDYSLFVAMFSAPQDGLFLAHWSQEGTVRSVAAG